MKLRKSEQARDKAKQLVGSRRRKSLTNALRTFETLEDRKLLTVAPWSDGLFYPPIGKYTAWLPPTISSQQYAAISAQQYGNSGSGTGGLSGEGSAGFGSVAELEPNGFIATAQQINLGTGASQNSGLAINGRLDTLAGGIGGGGVGDEDFYRMDLRAGDIIDAAITGSPITAFDIGFWDASGREIIANTGPVGGGYPTPDSPLSTGGNASLAFVVPSTGVYYARVSEANAGGLLPVQSYTLTLQARRPVLESEPVGTVQTIFLDFDGATIRRELFGAFGTARLSPLSDFLPGWGLQPSDESRIIDKIITDFTSKFYGLTAISGAGGNGDYFATGVPGQFGVNILNSRDHADPFGQPHVSRLIIGGTVAELGIPTIGIAQSIDVGNFDTTETAVTLLDGILPFWGPIPRAASVPLEDVLVDAIASVTAHEAGHYFGSWHTLNNNFADQLMDTGGNLTGLIGVGADGIYGTPDDVDVQFGTDTYDPGASAIPIGRQNSSALIAFGLSTGTAGGSTIRGRTFTDANENRVFDAGDSGLASVRVYADLNGNGEFNSGEFSALSDSAGNYQLVLPAGTYTLRQVTPFGYRITTPVNNVRTVTVNAGQTVTGQDFGQVLGSLGTTGVKWNDVNGNGLRDTGEPGIGGVWIYIDEDGDNRIDIGEPATQTAADGTYRLNFPAAGTYTIREVIDPGFVQTFPGPAVDNEHTITITGNPLTDAAVASGLNFGNTLTVDFGDAAASYGVASHGFIPGLILGLNWDAEQASQFSATATGDDTTGAQDGTGSIVDDEDGVVLSRPIVAGSTNNRFAITTTNTTGSPGYLSAWADFNQDGDFDANERIISDTVLNGGTTDVTFSIPATALLGSTVTRFRYSAAQGIGPTGGSGSGEVEDYRFDIVETLQIAVDDNFRVSRNSAINRLDVLANDFRLTGETLSIVSVSGSRAGGIVQISSDGVILYTPPSGFVGQDVFDYTMRNSGGDIDTATVVVDVELFFADPVAVDDSFDVPTNVIDRPLNVLQNDIEGQNGALSIISVTQPSQGGQVSIATGGKSLRYTPARGFGGTEMFNYTVSDAGGNTSSATVTVHTLPGDRADDDVLIRLVTTDLAGNPISAIQQGQEFRVEMRVDDLRFDAANPGTAAGVFAAYTDLLYNLQLVSTVPATNADSNFNFEVTFFNDYVNFQQGDESIPGIIDDFGSFSSRGAMNEAEPLLLAAITFAARSPGMASFIPDPADDFPFSDTLLFDTPGSAVPVERIRYIGTNIEIVGDGVEFPVAVDDSVATPLPAGAVSFPITVLANDRPGSTGSISIVNSSDGLFGRTDIDTRGTANPADDRILYTANGGFSGTDQFTYTIRDTRGIESTATVTLRVGDATGDDLVRLRLSATDLTGAPIDQIQVGNQFQLRGFVQDLRAPGQDRGVFAAYQDVLYSSSLVAPVASTTNDPNLGFQIQFGPNYQRVREGDIRTAGVINEVGAVQIDNNGQSLGSGEELMFIITMTANSVGIANFISDPADITPLHDTLIYEPPSAVTVGQIDFGFDSLSIVSGSGGGSGEGFHNWSNAYDVNGDGFVTPIDALGIINSLNQGGSGMLGGSGGGEGEAGRLFVDTNNDGALSPIDALLVINHLNSRGGGGEGEAELSAWLSSGSLAESAQGVLRSGAVAAEAESITSKPSRIGVRMTSASMGPVQATLGTRRDELFDDGGSELEDLLSQLAPEIEKTWQQL